MHFEQLTLNAIRKRGNPRPPALTILLPGGAGGSRAGSAGRQLRHALDRVMEKLDRAGASHAEAVRLVAPIASLGREPALEEPRKHGLAILADHDRLDCFEVPAQVEECVVVANHFHLKPVLPQILDPQGVVILELAQGKVRLIEVTRDGMRERPLPRGVPENLEQISAPEVADHVRINRGAGRPRDRSKAISFGLMNASEDRRMEFFCAMLDRGLNPFLVERGLPLILAGGDRILAAYQRQNSYPETVGGVLHGNIEYLSHEEIVEHARLLITSDRVRHARQYLAQMEEFAPGDRWTGTLEEILLASVQGRIWRLFLAEGASCVGDFSSIGGYAVPGAISVMEDLLNAAAVQTLQHGGNVFLLPGRDLPGGAPAAAWYRYSLM